MSVENPDVVIIGAGLLGCFTARALSAFSLRTVVLEAREDVSTGISRANTGILYSGCDTKPGTLKTELCIRNRTAFPQLCRELEVPFLPCGSLLVACGARSEAVMHGKYEQGQRNGAPGLRLLGRDEALAWEPGLSDGVTGALYSPTTATVNPWELCVAAFENARENGSVFHFQERLLHMERTSGGFLLESEKRQYRARCVVNCAGLSSDAVREMLEIPAVRIFPDGADYLVLDAHLPGCPSRVIFQETETGKGVTLVPTVEGNLLVGPTQRPLNGAPPFSTTREGLEELERQARTVMPGLPLDGIIRSFGAMRPNPYFVRRENEIWVPEEKSIANFTVLEENGLISLIGIKTPGLTCAEGLGQYAADLAVTFLRCDARNPSYSPIRHQIPRVRDMTEQAWQALASSQPEFGQIVCRCRTVTRGEIREAVRRGAVTVDGVKRRSGACTGRCQGARCTPEILSILSQELQRPVWELTKDGEASQMVEQDKHGAV
jgi:glycerol-3-phosphate dehydrogenase